jgi:predicted O-methyltransferase YrrM
LVMYFGQSITCPICNGDGKISNYLDIVEALNDLEGATLATIAGKASHPGCLFLEIGSWKGFSTTHIGNVAHAFRGTLYCIDHWKGNKDAVTHKGVKNCLSIFCKNIDLVGLAADVKPMVMSSSEALKIFQDGILDFIFIDADHVYENVLSDIQNWWKKLKVGGYMCGHDNEKKYSEYNKVEQKLIDESLGDDYISQMECHPGVTKALYDIWKDDYEIVPNTHIWVKRKEKE